MLGDTNLNEWNSFSVTLILFFFNENNSHLVRACFLCNFIQAYAIWNLSETVKCNSTSHDESGPMIED